MIISDLIKHDNVRPHKTAVPPWSAKSRDISPIELLWDIIYRRLNQLPSLLMDLRCLGHDVQVI